MLNSNEKDQKSLVPLTPEQLKNVEETIAEYMDNTFEEDFTLEDTDLSNIELAYTTLTDNEIPIQVSLDLVNMKLNTYIKDKLEESVDYDYDMIVSGFDFDSLISGWEERAENGEFDSLNEDIERDKDTEEEMELD